VFLVCIILIVLSVLGFFASILLGLAALYKGRISIPCWLALAVCFLVLLGAIIAIPVPEKSSPPAEEAASAPAEEATAEAAPETAENPAADSEAPPEEAAEERPESKALELHMLDVGQGLSVLVGQNGHYLLYDGGTREASSYVVAYLKQHLGQDQKLDYIVSSHSDEDHIAGLIGALNVFTVDRVIRSNEVSETKIAQSFDAKLQENGAETIIGFAGQEYELGGAHIQIVSPAPDSELTGNNASVALRISCGDFSALLCGDAEAAAENAMLDSGANLDSDLYVVSHHGSYTSSGQAFLEAVSPAYALISVGKDNSYGHPHSETLLRLQDAGCQLYRTDLHGEIICRVQDGQVTFNVPACQDWTAGDGSAPEP